MTLNLTPEQERSIQIKLQSGKYRSVEEVIQAALWLLDEHDRADVEWIDKVREKIDVAVEESKTTPPIDGENFVSQILDKFDRLSQV